MGGVLFFLLLLVAGLLSLLAPREMWHLTKGWQFKDAEPSDAAVVYMRVAGVIEIIAAFYILFTM